MFQRPTPSRPLAWTIALAALVAMALACPPLASPLAAQQPPPGEAWVHLGTGVSVRHLPSPFQWRCETEEVEMTTVVGFGGHASLQVGGLDFSVSLSASRRPTDVVCLDLSVWTDGVHVVDRHHGEVDGDWMQAMELGLGYSPARSPFLRGSVGAGWIRGTDAPFGTATLGLRLGGRLRLLADLGAHVGSAPYVQFREEWQGGKLVRSQELRQGRNWAIGPTLHVGIEGRL